MPNNIYITKPYLPPLEEYIGYVKKAWDNQYLTNGGPLVQELEEKLKRYFKVKHVLYVSNGTMALQLAIKALGIKKEIITTPFSFVASASSIVWQNCKPKFIDIDPYTLCIDPNKIEDAITTQTQAILPVHIYGYPCDVESIAKIAKKYKLRVIYDAAHAFGTSFNDTSLFSYGDVSAISFHATKLFHTGEGGAVVTNDDDIAEKIKLMRNFGIRNDAISNIGINGKNSELHAAMGLALFPHIVEIINKRKALSETYDRFLRQTSLVRPATSKHVAYNYAYYPVIFQSEEQLINVSTKLQLEKIYAKRYFYPSLNTLPYVQYISCPIAESVAKRVLCLPLYPDLSHTDIKHIAQIVISELSAYKQTNNDTRTHSYFS